MIDTAGRSLYNRPMRASYSACCRSGLLVEKAAILVGNGNGTTSAPGVEGVGGFGREVGRETVLRDVS